MNSAEGSLLRTRASLLFRLQEAPDDQDAWQRFVVRYEPEVKKWCKHWGLQEADAADVTQMILLRLTKVLPAFQYDPTKRFRAWLKTLAQHAWSDFSQKQRQAMAGTGDSAVLAVINQAEAREDLVARLQETFDHEILEMAYRQVQDRVEERTWQAFVLTAVHHMKGADVAKQVGMNVAAVFMAKSKVTAMLRDIVRKAEEEQ